MKTKACKQCGKAFVQEMRGREKLFCSRKCKNDWWNAHPKPVARNICARCGQLFYSKHVNQPYCGRECYNMVRFHGATRLKPEKLEELQKQLITPVHCRTCGILVDQAIRSDQRVFCSKKCQRRWDYLQNHDKMQPLPEDEEKREFARLRKQGLAYGKIATILGKSKSTVKWWGVRYYPPEGQVLFSQMGPSRIIKKKDDWRGRLNFHEETGEPKQRRIFLVCGKTDYTHGLENLYAIIRYRLGANPFDGDLYVFCGSENKKLITVEWIDGGFCIGSRRVHGGTYPWPPKKLGQTMEITEEDLRLLLSFSPKKFVQTP